MLKIAIKVAGYVLRLGFLDGYRLYFLGAASMLAGLGHLALAAAGDARGDIEVGLGLIGLGWGIIGGAGKADKLIEATNANTLVTAATSAEVPSVPPQVARDIVKNLPGPVPIAPGPSEH